VNKNNKVKILAIVLAVLFGLGISRETIDLNHYPQCSPISICDDKPTGPNGILTKVDKGYPITYKQTSSFRMSFNEEKDNASYEIENIEFIELKMLVNIVFWFPLLNLIIGKISTIKSSKKNSKTK